MVGGELLEVLVEKGKQILFGKAFRRCMFGRVIVEDEEAGTVVQSRGSRSTIIVVSAIAPIIIAAVVPLARPAASLRSPGHEFRAFSLGRIANADCARRKAVMGACVEKQRPRYRCSSARHEDDKFLLHWRLSKRASIRHYILRVEAMLGTGQAWPVRSKSQGRQPSVSGVRPKICAVTPATHGQQDHDGVNPTHGGSSDVGSVLVTGHTPAITQAKSQSRQLKAVAPGATSPTAPPPYSRCTGRLVLTWYLADTEGLARLDTDHHGADDRVACESVQPNQVPDAPLWPQPRTYAWVSA
ncbi:hypothetical protein ETB97_000604 [Aspergillus alliaceus]|uniref:Uncharacterized protein n=1 Tax=Petromyces alliaceus TaxID=209559 RepID=A0A8H6E786_PETAA|nr:hypothetical protein ETB97_000604 [Aspergillus burnettii]